MAMTAIKVEHGFDWEEQKGHEGRLKRGSYAESSSRLEEED
jgi:hypothetical protein